MNKRHLYLAILASLGSALEYYCFVTYVMLTPYLAPLFFPKAHQDKALLFTLLIFASAYLSMPLSSFIFGHFADRYGRRMVLSLTVLLMALATCTMGLLPTAMTWGATATILLVLLRLIQGFAQGGELPGAIIFITEHVSTHHSGRYTGILFFGVGSGALLSTLINYLLTHYLSHSFMVHIGWRIPFLLGGFLGLIAYLIRRTTLETPAFLAVETKVVDIPVWTLMKNYYGRLIVGLGLVFFAATMVAFTLSLPAFLQQNFHFKAQAIYLAMTLGFALDLSLILFGMIGDWIGLARFYLLGIIIDLILLFPAFLLLKSHSLCALYSFIFLTHVMILLLAACYPTLLARLFPTQVRYSGVSLSYLSAYSLAGMMPVLINWLYLKLPSLIVLAGLFTVLALVSVTAVLYYRHLKC